MAGYVVEQELASVQEVIIAPLEGPRVAELGVERSAEEIVADYVYGSFQGPTITMLGAMGVGQTDRGDEMLMAMAHRAVAQIQDWNALDLIR